MSKPKRSEKFVKTGHSPFHLRECLLNALSDFKENWWSHLEIEFFRERHERWWKEASASERAYWLLGQLWHCTDVVPSFTRSDVAEWLNAEEGDFLTFAQLSRALKLDLDETLPGSQSLAAV